MDHHPQPGDTVKAWMHTTDGQLVHAEVVAMEVDKLGCDCRRIRALRPGPVFDRACTEVSLLTGCAWHPNHLSADLAEARRDRAAGGGREGARGDMAQSPNLKST